MSDGPVRTSNSSRSPASPRSTNKDFWNTSTESGDADRCLRVPAQKLTVGYWACRGLAAPLRMMCAFKDADYVDHQYELFQNAGCFECPPWEEDRQALLTHNPFAALPFVIDGNTVVATAPASSAYLAHKLGLAGANESERLRCQQALAIVYELRNDAMRVLYGPLPVYEQGHRGYLERTARTHYGKLNRWLEMHRTLYLTSDDPAQPDFELWEMLDMHELWANDTVCTRPLSGFTALTKLYDALRDLDVLQTYFKSPQFLLPFNNKMAHFRDTESSWREHRELGER